MIRLVSIEDKHAESFVKLLNNRNVSKWLLSVPFPYTIDHANSFIELSRSEAYRKSNISFAIESEGIHVGGIGLHFKDMKNAEAGFWLGEEYWRRGYMTTALNMLLDKARIELNLPVVTAVVFDGNESSEGLLKKCGFAFEGFIKKPLIKDGEKKKSKLYKKNLNTNNFEKA